MTIAARLRVVRGEIAAACAEGGRDPATVSLLPVSKRHPAAAILEAKAAGLMSFGESRVQELSSKGTELDGEGLAWHLIGSLQTNKVHQLVRVPGLVMVHSLDRIKLATALQVALSELDRKLAVLLQVDATGEANKHGVSVVEAPQLLECVVRDGDGTAAR